MVLAQHAPGDQRAAAADCSAPLIDVPRSCKASETGLMARCYRGELGYTERKLQRYQEVVFLDFPRRGDGRPQRESGKAALGRERELAAITTITIA